MTIPSTLSNVLIEGNTFEGTSAYQYDILAEISADSRINNNYFSGLTPSSPYYMLDLVNCSCVVSNNIMVRGSNSLSAYINNAGSYDQIITENIFDGYTVDGTNTDLVSNLTNNSLYTRNKNQVGYAIIPLSTNKPAIYHLNAPIGNAYSLINSTDIPFTATNDVFTTSGYLYDMMVLKIFDIENIPTAQHFTTSVNLSNSIPSGAKIIDAKISIFNPSGASSVTLTSGDSFIFALNISRNHVDSLNIVSHPSTGITSSQWMLAYTSAATFTSTGTDLYPSAKTLEIATLNYSGTVIDSSGNSSIISNTDISNNYVAGNDYSIIANLAFNYESSATGSTATPLLLVSPIVITYVF